MVETLRCSAVICIKADLFTHGLTSWEPGERVVMYDKRV
jgi:hypothetical protein